MPGWPGGGRFSGATVVAGLLALTVGLGLPRSVEASAGRVDGGPAGFILISPGTFLMGSTLAEARRDSDETPHQVTLTKSLYLSDHEVTQGEWQAAMGWNDSQFRGADLPFAARQN